MSVSSYQTLCDTCDNVYHDFTTSITAPSYQTRCNTCDNVYHDFTTSITAHPIRLSVILVIMSITSYQTLCDTCDNVYHDFKMDRYSICIFSLQLIQLESVQNEKKVYQKKSEDMAHRLREVEKKLMANRKEINQYQVRNVRYPPLWLGKGLETVLDFAENNKIIVRKT